MFVPRFVAKFSPSASRNRNRVRARLLKSLGQENASIITTVETELDPATADTAERAPRVHRLSQHLGLYESEIDRSRPIRLLEIGSFYWDSQQEWKDYLDPGSLVIGIDFDSKFLKILDESGTRVRMGGARDISFLRDVATEFGPFTAIIDADSQSSSRLVNNFRCLFPHSLSPDGVYLIEDVYCDFWTLYNSFSFIDMARALIDVLRGHYQFARDTTEFGTGHLVIARYAAGRRPQRLTS
ncbi:hypothetical protein [Mycobacterium vicinigordonae]|uniref:Class I SAM-dependent methyltransferase n=1 Tax=Mycobacterium vicinigordonae TaxID=1719132 RepID=A0A7D6E1W7_9MYCO|nr:hypothetical protein [Mycobacterium vicinigordonae]QLL07801.1 hypothetical protein H0P51_01985 [Mycobacterium vicinigordonae]